MAYSRSVMDKGLIHIAHLRIDKGSRAMIYIIGSGAETMTTTATIYISYESSYFSVHVGYITFGLVL